MLSANASSPSAAVEPIFNPRRGAAEELRPPGPVTDRHPPALTHPLAHGIISAAAAGSADLMLQFCGFAFRRASFRPGRDRPVGLVGYLLLGASAHKEPTAGLFCYVLLRVKCIGVLKLVDLFCLGP